MKKDKKEREINGAYVTTIQELEELDIENTDCLLGTQKFQNSPFNAIFISMV